MDEARATYPTPPDMPDAQRVEQYHKQSQYFEQVERMAREHREELEAKRLFAPDDERAWNSEEIEGTRVTELAAKVRPAQGRLPLNHEDAGKRITVETIDERIADLTLDQKQRVTLQRARKVMAETGVTEVHIKEDGYPDFEPFVYKNRDGVAADVEIALVGGKRREPDFDAARDAYREKIGDPRWDEPSGYTWHHHEQIGRMLLVRREIHEAFRHTGAIPLFRILVGDLNAYRGSSK